MSNSPKRLRRIAAWAVALPALLTICAWLLPLVLSGCDVIGSHHECYLDGKDVTPVVLLAQAGCTLLLLVSMLMVCVPLLFVAYSRSRRQSKSAFR